MIALEIAALRKSYGKQPVLQGLDLTVQEGEVYGFLGRNGAGKSTTIRLIMGISRADSGTVRLFGRDLRKHEIELRQRIGYVAQEQNFYGWMTPETIGQFVGGFFPTWDAQEYGRLVHNLDLPAARKIRTFSGGMRTKLALALALAHRPPLLVLDEPTAGLDPVARREFIEMVREQAAQDGRTTFFSSHLIDEIEAAADRVGIIEAGRTCFEGTLGALAGCVQRLSHPLIEPAPPLPSVLADAGATILQDRVQRGERQVVVRAADPALFEQIAQTQEVWAVSRLSMEDIFVDMVGKRLS